MVNLCFGPHRASLIVLGMWVFLTGCGPAHPPTYPVSGKVVFADDVPLTTGGVIRFASTSAQGESAFNASGVIQADGTFLLSTFGDGDGAVAGHHRAIVRATRIVGLKRTGGRIDVPPPVIDRCFERYDTSGLQFNVQKGSNEFEVVIQKPARSGHRR